ncbi:hypothetical protein AAG570_002659 [Ranatra chinensis]|uniref:Uncharacterized protein n=1 Tax=Ranatra chinensis TaxID=642074 RepID=A0ABD0YQX7_9HEMI
MLKIISGETSGGSLQGRDRFGGADRWGGLEAGPTPEERAGEGRPCEGDLGSGWTGRVVRGEGGPKTGCRRSGVARGVTGSPPPPGHRAQPVPRQHPPSLHTGGTQQLFKRRNMSQNIPSFLDIISLNKDALYTLGSAPLQKATSPLSPSRRWIRLDL